MKEINDALQEEVEKELTDDASAQASEDVTPAEAVVTAESETPKAKKEPKYNPLRIAIYSVLAGLAFVIGVSLITLSVWYVDAFNLEFKHLLYNLASPVEGTGGGTINQILSACLPWILLGVAVYVVAAVLIARRSRLFMWLRRAGAILCVLVMLSSTVVTLFSFRIPQYLASLGQQTTLYEEYYIDPADVMITADGKTKNLIYIYLESMETGFASEEVGGLQDNVNYIPSLTQLAKDNISFSDKGSGLIGGFYTFEGVTSWTMGSLFAITSGLPFNFPVGANDMGKQEAFAPGITTLGDILESKGYSQVFLCGSDAAFGGREKYFVQHGNYQIYDLYTARQNGDLPTKKYYNGFWGFEDKYLYEIAKKEITRLAAEDAPFNMTLLTVDTHFPKGYMCSECEAVYDKHATYDGNMRNVLLCADHQVTEFVNWCKAQPFYEDTVIVISGDHPIMGTQHEMIEGLPMNDRPVYNCFINSAVQPVAGTTENRIFTSMDMFPSTLAAMGFNITGNRLAMGVNMFSGQKTVIEYVGYDTYAEEVVKSSDYYNRFTGFSKDEETT